VRRSLESAAAYAGANVVGVVLTGMGNDGAQGVQAVKAGRGWVLAQDEASSVIFGMPAEAIRTGLWIRSLALTKCTRQSKSTWTPFPVPRSRWERDDAAGIPGLIPRDARPREQVVLFSIGEYSFVISASSVQKSEVRTVWAEMLWILTGPCCRKFAILSSATPDPITS